MRPQCTDALEPQFPRGTCALTQRRHELNEAKCDHTREQRLQRGSRTLLHRGHDFNEATMCLCTRGMSSMRPQCAHAQEPEFQ